MNPRYAKALLLLCLFATNTNFASASAPMPGIWQQNNITVKGKVKDANGNPLPGVTVRVKDTPKGAATDASGNYVLTDVKKDAVLIFQYIGFDSQEVKLEGKTSLNLTMGESQKVLDEYVVVGYGTQKKVTKTGAVSSVKGAELQQSPNVNVSNALVGRVPGVIAINNSGEPGNDNSRIFVRGRSTLGNNNPLVVIDGFPRVGFERINGNDIESVSVLKDAAAAIYGSRAANGVILINTKRGKIGKPTVTYGFNQSFVTPTRLPKMADAQTYAQVVNEINAYGGQPAKYTPEEIKKFGDGSDPWLYPNTDWYDAAIKKISLQNRHDLSLSGGNEKMLYYVSIGTLFQDGIYKSSANKYKQQSVRANLDANVNDNIKLKFNLAGRLENRNYPPRSAGSIFRSLMRGRPTENAIWPNGLPGPDIEYGDNPVVTGTNAIGYTNDKNYVINTDVAAIVNIPWVTGLSVDGSFAYDQNFDVYKSFIKPWTLYTLADVNDPSHKLNPGSRGVSAPEFTQNFNSVQQLTYNVKLNYVRSFGKHNLSTFVAFEQASMRADTFGAFRKYYISDKLDLLNLGGDKEKNNNGTAAEFYRRNYFGRISYNFKETYLFDFNLRYDGSQNFPAGRRMGAFPGASAGWVLSNENFWKQSIRAVNYFKIRAAWGQMGNDQIDPFQYLSTYGFSAQGVMLGGDLNKAIYQLRSPNPQITWEVANNYDVGIEAGLLGDKLTFEGDYFLTRRSNILVSRSLSVPAYTGMTLPQENIGRVENKGFELVLRHKNDIRKFHYEVTGTVTHAQNRILYWDETPNVPAWQQSTGKQIDAPLYYQAIGIYKDAEQVKNTPHLNEARPGDIIFADVNGDGKIDDLDKIRVNRTENPTWIYGLTLNAKYSNFDITMLWQGAGGASQYLRTESGLIGNFPMAYVEDRWTEKNTSASWPRAFDRDREYWVGRQNTFWFWNTSYVRLKTLDLGYNVPETLCRRYGLQNLRVYVSGQNLLTFDKVKIFDPEAPQGSGQFYPQTKIYNVGVKVTF
ncbi:SusC/RagA family TonB-linked outer membrane protein [Chitinophaga arvensicola]|uniref:TonB-linked outer membrane protein, SusC/RagA family n=1 Tax=Chitinophaga arvensicola TaxID=29529 RepID=A0A1I0QNP3_9BACT|nr:TonB-dependent receptor [Chitinophaga arvensicola]SEW28799.1 TonB-linked outer membrane protein, SusC/RagA family [Chitinophaga arvensicola]